MTPSDTKEAVKDVRKKLKQLIVDEVMLIAMDEEAFIDEILKITSHLQEQTRREWEVKVAKAVKHGTLPIPNPYGTTVSLRRHNQVVREMKQILDSQESEGDYVAE